MTQAKLAAAFAGCSIAELGYYASLGYYSFAWTVASVALVCLTLSLHRSRT